MNIRPSLRLRAIIRPSFSMKHPPSLKRTCMPCSTIWPTETKFFVMVSTCKTFLMYVWLPSLLNGTLPMCRIRWVVSSPALNITGLIRSSKVLKPFLMRHRMVRDTGVDKPYVFRIGGTSQSGGQHRICSMSHHKHSSMVVIVGVGGIIGELSACVSRHTLPLSALSFMVADFTAISAFSWVVLSAWTIVKPPPFLLIGCIRQRIVIHYMRAWPNRLDGVVNHNILYRSRKLLFRENDSRN